MKANTQPVIAHANPAEQTRSPEAGPVLGVFLITLGLLFSAATGGLVNWFVQRQSFTGLIIMTLVLAWPLVPLSARPIGMAIKDWRCRHAKNTSETPSGS